MKVQKKNCDELIKFSNQKTPRSVSSRGFAILIFNIGGLFMSGAPYFTLQLKIIIQTHVTIYGEKHIVASDSRIREKKLLDILSSATDAKCILFRSFISGKSFFGDTIHV